MLEGKQPVHKSCRQIKRHRSGGEQDTRVAFIAWLRMFFLLAIARKYYLVIQLLSSMCSSLSVVL